jgi:hypothetical protein
MNTITVTNNDVIVRVDAKYFGSFYDTTDQLNSVQVNKMKLNTTDISNGVSIVSNSRITISNAGVYNIQFSAQFDKTDSGTDAVEVWLCKNGNNIANTNTELTLAGNNAKIVAAWNWFTNAAAGDYYEICWYSADSAVFINAIAAGTSPTRPAIPSVILTVNQIA